jgi:hypothetical protein
MLSHSFQEQSHSSAVYSVTRQNEKSYRSKLSTQEASIQGTSFHMDLGFVRCAGPNNLQEVLRNGAPPQEIIIIKTPMDSAVTYSLYLGFLVKSERSTCCRH